MSTLVSSVLSSHKPCHWDSGTSYATNGGVRCVHLSTDDSEYSTLRDEVYASLKVEPTHIVRVQNPFLFGQYTLRKEQMKKKGASNLRELELWHATSTSNAENIMKTNFDWRRTVRNKFGQGVSFSPDASYANTQANRNIGSLRALIRARVLGNAACSGSSIMRMPPGAYDTSTGNNGKVYVKYYDHEFYPEYIVYYNTLSTVSRPYQQRHSRYHAYDSDDDLDFDYDYGNSYDNDYGDSD